MKQTLLSNLFGSMLVGGMLLSSSAVTAQTSGKVPSFPGAQGYGMYVTGGRGGAVYHVTTLEDTGEKGSFRYACNQKGARTIVFDVSGTIFLKSQLNLTSGDVTIAGQTAPGDGICIADWPFVIKGPNVILRYLRFRCGNRNVSRTDGDGGHEGDGLGGFDGANIIIDHCTVSWSIDECLAVYGNRNTTVQWCMAYQSLREAGHSKGAHGYGAMMGGGRTTYHHNLIAHHDSRTPRYVFRSGDDTSKEHPTDWRNNVVYNWGGNGAYGGEEMNINIVNNYYKPGPLTEKRPDNVQKRILGTSHGTHYVKDVQGNNTGEVEAYVWGHYYVAGNKNTKWADVTADNWKIGVTDQISDGAEYGWSKVTRDTIKAEAAMPFALVTTHTADKAFEKVVAYAGASLHRDALDQAIASDAQNGITTFTGANESDRPGIIDTQDDAKTDGDDAWPRLNSTSAPVDTDGDGMPDAWETANGLDPNDAADGAKVAANGYTNLENYINSLVADITEAQYADGEMTGEDIATTGPLTPTAIDATNAISIPNEDYFDLTKGTHTGGSIKDVNGMATIDNVRNGQYWSFVIDNAKEQAYTITFQAAAKNSEPSLVLDVTDGDGNKDWTGTVAITNTGNWSTFVEHSIDTDVLPAGLRYLILNFQGTKYTFNVGNIKFTPKSSTGIVEVNAATAKEAQIYTLSGMKVNSSRLQKGIYIVDGKKVVIK